MVSSIHKGQCDLLKFVYNRYRPHAYLYTRLAELAAYQQKWAIVEWLSKNGCLPGKKIYKQICRANRPELLHWAMRNIPESRVIKYCLTHNYVGCFRYL